MEESVYESPVRSGIVIILHNDEAGARHAQKVLKALPDAKTLRLPGENGVNDVSDWIAGRRAQGIGDDDIRSELEALANNSSPMARQQASNPSVTRGDAPAEHRTADGRLIPPERFVDHEEPLPLAENYIEQHALSVDHYLLIRKYRGEIYKFNDVVYEVVPKEEFEAALYRHLENLYTYKRNRLGEIAPTFPPEKRVTVNSSVIREISRAIPSRGALVRDRVQTPCGLPGYTGPASCIPVRPCTSG